MSRGTVKCCVGRGTVLCATVLFCLPCDDQEPPPNPGAAPQGGLSLTSATRTLVPREIWGSLVSLLTCKARRATAPTVRQGFRQGFVQRPPPPPRSQSVLLKVRQLERPEGPSHGLLTSRGAHSKSAQLAKHWQVCVERLPGIPPPSLPPSRLPSPLPHS